MANERTTALKERILIVDDTPDDLQVLSTYLARHGYQIYCVATGEMALKEAVNFQPELILLDILMPGVNGYQVCKQLKANNHTEGIPVIFLSALDDVLDKVRAFEMGGVDYITKPFQIKEVLARVENQLTIKRLQRGLREQNEQLQQEMQSRKLAEEAVREKEQYLRLVIDNIPQQVFWKDTNLVFRGCNKNWAEAAGFEDSETVVGKTDYELVLDRQVADAFRATDQQVIETNTPLLHIVATKQNPPADGESVWLDINKLPIHDEEGRVIGVLGVLEDITDRRRADLALRASEAKYRDLVETANCIILRWDTKGCIRFLNTYGQRFFGYDEAELLGKPLLDTIVPELETTGRNLRTFVQDICDHPERYPISEHENLRRNGCRAWISWANKPILDDQGQLIEILSIGTDATERKLAEAALKQEQAKSERLLLNILPSVIAHRLKENEGSIADAFEEVTVLFADIVGFTQLSSKISPREVVGLLNRVFSLFDQLCDCHGLEKIKTVGDAYMVVGGLPSPRADHAIAIAKMALDMQREVKQFRTRDDSGIDLRIGINTGPVVAGVIGTKRFSYDLWGDTVNVASRMESQGEGGRIQVTPSTYDRLHQQFVLEQRGTIFVKGRGEMTTYWLKGGF